MFIIRAIGSALAPIELGLAAIWLVSLAAIIVSVGEIAAGRRHRGAWPLAPHDPPASARDARR